MPRLYNVNQLLRCYYVALARIRPSYVNFEHVQCSSTSSASMETKSRPNRILLHSHDVVQLLTASCRFFVDVVLHQATFPPRSQK